MKIVTAQVLINSSNAARCAELISPDVPAVIENRLTQDAKWMAGNACVWRCAHADSKSTKVADALHTSKARIAIPVDQGITADPNVHSSGLLEIPERSGGQVSDRVSVT